MPLDDVNTRLLTELAANPRISITALARTIGMSTPAIRDRIAQLEGAGVIRGYRLDLDPAALGLMVSAWVRVRPGPGQLSKIAELARRLPSVSECHRITGDDCFLLRVHAATIQDLEASLDQFLLHGQTSSAVIVSSPVPPRAPLPVAPG